MFKIKVSYKSGDTDLAELPEGEAREAVSRATLRMVTGDVVDVVAWEV